MKKRSGEEAEDAICDAAGRGEGSDPPPPSSGNPHSGRQAGIERGLLAEIARKRKIAHPIVALGKTTQDTHRPVARPVIHEYLPESDRRNRRERLRNLFVEKRYCPLFVLARDDKQNGVHDVEKSFRDGKPSAGLPNKKEPAAAT